jgi:hypothetical protein
MRCDADGGILHEFRHQPRSAARRMCLPGSPGPCANKRERLFARDFSQAKLVFQTD